jgi:hypothetical protein
VGLFDKLFGPKQQAAQAKKKPSGISGLARELAAHLLIGKASSADHANLGKLLTLLEKSPSGWDDAVAVVQHGCKVMFDMADGGALFCWPENVIILNRARVPRSLATAFCHEATYVRQRHSGRGSDPYRQSKDEFAETVVRNETETFMRQAIVGRELLHWERANKVPQWHQNLVEHPLQMWFALVHGAKYAVRPAPATLDADAALSTPMLGQLLSAVQPYFRRHVEPYRIVQHIKWDIARGRRPPLDSDTLRGVLEASFSKQSREDRNPYMNR